MLIIEGADNLGKTTAAQKLLSMAMKDDKFPVWYAHMGRPNMSFDFCSDYFDRINHFAIQDRFHLGSLVWHCPGTMTALKLKAVERNLADVGSLVVVFHCSIDKIYDKLLTDKPKAELFGKEKLMEANRAFRDLPLHPHVDVYWDFARGGYPTGMDLRSWLATWYSRLESRRGTHD